uniref:hypothetical protein n=1 Tax=Candidatus Phytoplasma sp. AldY-WA1 TaxID=2852100 RepID=UPI00254B8106
MFLERKIQNLFFLIFIIILVWFPPLYLVKANEAKVVKISQSCKKIPSFTINSKSNNTKLHSPAKLTFDIYNLDDIEKTKEERKYFYKLTFEDKDLLKELDKKKQALKDKSFVCHLNTSIFDSDNNPLTDLFDIKCSYRKSGTNDSFDEFKNLSQSRDFYARDFYEIDMDKKRLELQKERKFSFFKIDLEEWAYDIQIEIKTKKEELYLKKYKKLENDKKKIKLKCELDITDKDNYPVYLFENISKTIKNISKTNCDFDMSKTNYDFDFISSSDVKILSNPIWLVFKKNNEFLILDLIINQEVKYKEYKKYQDLMDLYHSSWKKRIENKFDDEFDRNLISLESIVDENKKKNSEIIETISSLKKTISVKKQELNNLKPQLKKKKNNSKITETISSLNKTISFKEGELNNLKLQLKNENNSRRISSLNKTISVKEQELNNAKSQLKEQELNNLESQLEENILNQKETQRKYDSSNKEYLEECKKKEDKIKQEFDSNNVSRIKLYFLKEIYDINNSDTHSSLHVKHDWDIGEIKYDGGASNKRFNN